MRKQKIRRAVLWLIVIAVAAGIFCFSAQDATVSNDTSNGFVKMIFNMFPSFRALSLSAQTELIESIMFTARKCAHFCIYAFFGFWLLFLVREYRKDKAVPIASATACFYAVTDEIHQRFVPGRSGQFKDVCIDTAGAVTGALIALLLIFFWQKLRKKRRKQG